MIKRRIHPVFHVSLLKSFYESNVFHGHDDINDDERERELEMKYADDNDMSDNTPSIDKLIDKRSIKRGRDPCY